MMPRPFRPCDGLESDTESLVVGRSWALIEATIHATVDTVDSEDQRECLREDPCALYEMVRGEDLRSASITRMPFVVLEEPSRKALPCVKHCHPSYAELSFGNHFSADEHRRRDVARAGVQGRSPSHFIGPLPATPSVGTRNSGPLQRGELRVCAPPGGSRRAADARM
jgi:hypothetical protein